MESEIYDLLIQYGDKQASYVEELAALEGEKFKDHLSSRFDEVREETVRSRNFIMSSVSHATKEFREFNNFAAKFSVYFNNLCQSTAEHASILCVLKGLWKVSCAIYEEIQKYKELNNRINEEIATLKSLIEEVNLKSDYSKPLAISNYLLDTDYKNAKEMVEGENVDYYSINAIKEKIYLTSKDGVYLEQIQYILDRFYVIKQRIGNNKSTLYALMADIKSMKANYFDRRDSAKESVDYDLYELKDFYNNAETYKVKKLLGVLEFYNPGQVDFDEDGRFKGQVKDWVYATKNYIYSKMLGGEDE